MTPRLLILRSLWTNGFSLESALEDITSGEFDGVEGPVPADADDRAEFANRIRIAGVPFIAEVATGGGYVPVRRSASDHLDDLARQLDEASEATPRAVTALFGSDSWSLGEAVDGFGQAMKLAADRELAVSFETHRSRPTFNPWVTAEILRQLPRLQLTCDFSHWCCVCERLVLDDEPALLALFASRARHIHARVGYAQGPQVPHPAAPEYRDELLAHERWWDAIVATQRDSRREITLTPEFGPDGYLHADPFLGHPVANLDEINRWMAMRQRDRFALRQENAVSGGVR